MANLTQTCELLLVARICLAVWRSSSHAEPAGKGLELQAGTTGESKELKHGWLITDQAFAPFYENPASTWAWVYIRMNLQLSGKTALITGSTAGIGHAIAVTLLNEGARVIVNGRTQARVDRAIQAFEPGSRGRAIGMAADVGTAVGVAQMVERFADVDILINNMGIFEPKPFAEIVDADWFRFFEANVMSGVRLSRHYLPRMIAAGWGRIIFISSESAIQIPAEMIHYGMTKTAQLSISRGLAETTAGTGVTVNAVLPGPTQSEGVTAFVDQLAKDQEVDAATVEREFFRSARPSSLLRRFEKPEEIAALVAFVASPLSSGTNGAALRVDGGVVRSIV